MKISGYFQSDAPYVLATVIQEDINLAGYVRFLVDSGASTTVLSQTDAVNLEINCDHLQQLPGGILGVGGVVDAFIIPQITLSFQTDTEIFSIEMNQIYVIRRSSNDLKNRTSSNKIPSLLGRDFLNQYTLIMNQTENLLCITDNHLDWRSP